MYHVSWSAVLLIPLVMNLCALALVHVFYTVRAATHRSTSDKMRIYRCGVCAHVYEDARGLPLSRCPHCGCLNDPVRR